MNDRTAQDPLELEVTNFGPIIEAKVKLRPLTVFVGPSNTGKSYLAILIYALHQFFSTGLNYWFFPGALKRKMPKETSDAVLEWGREAFRGETEGASVRLSDFIVDEIRSKLEASGTQLAAELIRCFGIGKTSALIRKGSRNEACVLVRKHSARGDTPVEHRLTLKAKEAELVPSIPAGLSISIDNRERHRWKREYDILEEAFPAPMEDTDREILAREQLQVIANYSLSQLSGDLRRAGFYLPADRTGVMHAHRGIVSAIINSASMAGLRPDVGTPMLSGVLADFLRHLIELDRPPHLRRRSYRSRSDNEEDLGKPIEKAILDGEIRVVRSETINYPHFAYRPKGWKDSIPLMNASSMVLDLAPVVLYLRHLVEPDETLIIEEPESHLHPAIQAEFIRQIAALVQAGVRVIITTHSEWIMEELANIVRRSELPEAHQNAMPRGKFALHPDQVGVWLFKPKSRPRGSVVKEIRLDDSGLYPSGYDEIASTLHNDWVEISSLQGETE